MPDGHRIKRDAEVMHRDERLLAQGARHRRVMPDPHRRQQVGFDGVPDELVAERETILVLTDESVLDRLLEPVGQVGVQDPVAATRCVRRARRATGELGLELVGDRGQAGALKRPPDRREEAEGSPSLRRQRGDT